MFIDRPVKHYKLQKSINQQIYFLTLYISFSIVLIKNHGGDDTSSPCRVAAALPPIIYKPDLV